MAAVAAGGQVGLVSLFGEGGVSDLVLIGIVQAALGVALIRSSEGVVSSALQQSPPPAAVSPPPAASPPPVGFSSVCFGGSSVAQAFHANAPMPAMNTRLKSPVMILRTASFPYPS